VSVEIGETGVAQAPFWHYIAPSFMLRPAERKALKARAHSLNPIVTIGGKGLTDAVIAEIDFALKAHELIKVRAATLEREAREEALSAICERTGAAAVQHIGKILVLYRKNDEGSA
jgi:putative YhbY family RNA-binding protein